MAVSAEKSSRSRKAVAESGLKRDPPAVAVSRALSYSVARVAHPDWSRAKCARAAGYSQGYQAEYYSAEVRRYMADLGQYRDALRQCPETSLGALVAHLAGIVHGTTRDPETGRTMPTESARDRVAAIKQASTMLGYDAPSEVHTVSAHLIMDLGALASDDLAAIRAAVPTDYQEAD